MASIILAVIAVAGLAHGIRQPVPNISGTWIIVPEASVWRGRLGNPVNIRIFGEGFTARQDARTLIMAIDNEKGFEWRYNLDGAESRHTVPSAIARAAIPVIVPSASSADWTYPSSDQCPNVVRVQITHGGR